MPADVRPRVAPRLWWLVAPLLVIALAITFRDGLANLVHEWGRDEYSYAYIVPPITAWLIWQKRGELAAIEPQPSWWGTVLALFGLILAVFGELSTIYTILHYALIVTLFGVALAVVGWRGLRVVGGPLFYLFFAVPLPQFLYQGLSIRLQMISSELGVALIRALGISVFLEGNVIDLGTYQLQVVEACNGLRYLFPLLGFGYLFVLLYKGPWWHKLILLVSTLPITVIVNSVRIGITGVLVEHYGSEMAEGFLHAFEGWLIFLVAVAVLVGEAWLLARLSGRGRLGELMRWDLVLPVRGSGAVTVPASRPLIAATGLAVVAAVTMVLLPSRPEVVPEHRGFTAFPMRIDDWQGRQLGLEREFIDALKFDDYLLADFRRAGDGAGVGLYVAWYGSQRKGASVHSPRSCIPGGGWEIADMSVVDIPGVAANGAPLPVNRVVIGKGNEKQLVYYWFDQRGRRMTNEYYVKIMLFWDALTRNRTDGALVRLTTMLRPGEDLAAADRRLATFAKDLYPRFEGFLPS